MGILKILFVITLLTFPFGEIIRLEIVRGAAVNLNTISVGILAIYYIFYHVINNKGNKGRLSRPIIIFTAVCILSLLFNINSLTIRELGVSSLYIVRFIIYLLIYFAIFDFDRKFQAKIIYIMVFAGTLVLLSGYIQYFFYPSLRNLFYLGWDEHLYRMFSVFLDPNFAGAFFSLSLFLTIGLVQEAIERKSKYKILLFGILGILTFIAIFLTYSRSAILMVLVGLSIFLVLKKKWLIILVLAIISSFLIVLTPKAFKTEGTDLFRKVSSEARITSAKEAMLIFSKNPLLGVGFNAYKFARYGYGFTDLKFYPGHAEGGADVSLLFVLATTGIVGFTAYIWLLYKIIKYSYAKHRKNFIAQVLFVSTISLIINSFFINSLFYSFFMFWLWILVGLTENA
ncbi:MAG: O-antigen ligase family protein [Candidatus Levybacteria bacterium]|nr:O-antigen ligase family protein [Candidatus Levybacteria bacterium]